MHLFAWLLRRFYKTASLHSHEQITMQVFNNGISQKALFCYILTICSFCYPCSRQICLMQALLLL